MLHILLLILKIIGIILGVLLGIVLLGIVLALFVPVRYSVEASREEGEGNPPVTVKAKISWLLHFVNIRIRYPSEVSLRVRILFITIFKLPKQKKVPKSTRSTKKKTSVKEKKSAKTGQAEALADATDAGSIQDTADTETPKVKAETTQRNETAQIAETAPKTETAETAETVQKAETAETAKITETADTEQIKGEKTKKAESDNLKQSEGKKKKRRRTRFSVKGLWIKICKFFQNIWYTITGICDRIKTIWENIEYYLDILRSDTFQSSYALCKDELHAVFSYIKPRKFQADLVIGLGDPASTAKILSYYGILYPLVGNHVNIVPDFDEKRIEGTVLIKGKIKMFTFIKAAVRIYFNKDIKRLIKLFMKEDV